MIIKYFVGIAIYFITLKCYNLNLRTKEIYNNFSIIMIKKKNSIHRIIKLIKPISFHEIIKE